MTIPSERRNSIAHAKRFLRKLLDPKKSPKVPKWVRKEAYWCLRHYPEDFYLDDTSMRAFECFYCGKERG